MLEIKMHDGPARLGIHDELVTPGLLRPDGLFNILKDEPMPYDVPEPLAQFSVQKTIQYARESEKTGIAVIHGSKYLNLRIECALELEKLGNHILMVANPEELLKRPRDLIKLVVNIRQQINPNTGLYFPFAKMPFIPLLAYLGVDFFGDRTNDYYAQLGMITTPQNIYNQKNYQIYDFSTQELKEFNHRTMDFVLREIRENIRNGTLRNLVEERCCSSTETMSALKILDRDYSEFLDKYTQLY